MDPWVTVVKMAEKNVRENEVTMQTARQMQRGKNWINLCAIPVYTRNKISVVQFRSLVGSVWMIEPQPGRGTSDGNHVPSTT